MGLVEHAEYELKKAGYNIREINKIETSDDYDDCIAGCALDIVKLFSEQGHSGFSAQMTIALVEKLMKFKNLTPLTNDPEEWTDHVTEGVQEEGMSGRYQSKRNPSCFSDNLITYWDIDDPDNKEYEIVDGEKTGYYTMKKDKKQVQLKEVQNV